MIVGKETVYPLDYEERMIKYNEQVDSLAAQRAKFYEENPDCPYTTMFLNVISLPQKCILREVSYKDEIENL